MSTSQNMFQQPPTPAWRRNLRPVADPGLGDPGPFYCYSVSVPCQFFVSDWVRAFAPDGRLADRIEPGLLYCIKKDHLLEDIDRANGKGEEVFERQVQGEPQKVTNVPTNPADNKRFLNQVSMNHLPNHGGSGLTWFEPFKGLPESVVQQDLFSRMLRPVVFTPEYQEEHPEIVEAIKQRGALALYREMMEEGFKRIASREFAAEYGGDLQRLYLSVKSLVAACYKQAERYFTAMLNEEDSNVMTNGAKGARYSHLAEYGFYMTGRKGVNTALQRALEPQQVVVKMEGQAAAVALPAQIWCAECGTYTGLSPEGRPPKGCPTCKAPFSQEDAPTTDFTPDNPMGESALEKKQRLARDRNK